MALTEEHPKDLKHVALKCLLAEIEALLCALELNIKIENERIAGIRTRVLALIKIAIKGAD